MNEDDFGAVVEFLSIVVVAVFLWYCLGGI